MSGRRKGQFFIAGALVLCAAFFMFLPQENIFSSKPDADLSRLAENLGSELPVAFNTAILEDGDPTKLGEFTSFLKGRLGDRFLDFNGFFVATIPDETNPGDMQVYAGNWLGKSATATVSVDGDLRTIPLDSQEMKSESFSGIGTDLSLDIGFEGRSWSGRIARDKHSLYYYINISRGESVLIREILG
jgi:hypothetical protein